MMRKYYLKNTFIVLLLVFIFQLMLGFVSAKEMEGFTLVSENEYLRLYLDYKTTETAVEEKSTGNIWYSNPQGREEVETIARGTARDELSAQILLSYYLPGNKQMFMNNYSDSIAFHQFEINPLENGIRIEYQIGKIWSDSDYVPQIIEKSVFEEKVLKNLPEEDQEFLLKQYQLFTLEEIEGGERRLDIHLFDEEKVLGNYFFATPELELKDNEMQELILYFLGVYMDNRKDITGLASFSPEDLAYLKENTVYLQKIRILPWDKSKIIETFKKSGYTPEKLGEDYQKLNLVSPRPNVRVFQVPIEYRLEGRELLVRIPVDEIIYPVNVIDASQPDSKITLPVYSLELLPYFGTADKTEEGYIFVPDGSGAIIELNNGRIDTTPYNKSVYGTDYSTEPREEMPVTGETINCPVFGLKKGEEAFMAVIEKGAPYAAIKADIAGRNNSYNNVSSVFTTLRYTVMELGDGEDFEISKMNIYQSRMPKGDIQLRYFFLAGDRADYVGMAHKYQEYLVEKFQLQRLQEMEQMPFVLEVLAAIDEQRPVMGIPRRVVKPLTTYTETRSIIDNLKSNGIDNITLRLTGWFAGGEKHYFPDKVRLEKKLGSQEDFKSLLQYLVKEEVEIYLDLSFLNVYRNTMFDGYNTRKHNARFINKKFAYIPDYNVATYQEAEVRRRQKQIVSPGYLNELIDNYIKDYEHYGLQTISFKYMGSQLNSDFKSNPDQMIDRQQSQEYIVEVMGKLEGKEYKVMVEGGKAYLFPYLNNIVKMPLFSTGYNIVDRGVPFLPIALHGFINYSGEPLNMSQNKYTLLKYIETGAVLYYKGCYRDSSLVKNTDFHQDYALNYEEWLAEAALLYQELEELLGDTFGERIVDHQLLAESLYKTIYSNGTSVIVNYNKETVIVEGRKIEGENFLLIQGESK